MTKTVSETTAGPVLIPPYFYDGSILLAEKVGSQIQKIYINDGQGIVGMVRPIYDNSNNLTHYQRLYYLYDSLGSVSAVTGEHGLPLQNYTYSPYGTCLNVTGDPINNLQFIGRYGGYLDNDTGLTYFWHRWYDSRDGRWVSRDPIGVIGGVNFYEYVFNRPNLLTDIDGYCPGTTVMNYGNHCGRNRIGGYQGPRSSYDYSNPYTVYPIDELDECCRQHDNCLTVIDMKVQRGGICKDDVNEQKRKCNRDLLNCAYQAKTYDFYFKLRLINGFQLGGPFTPGGGF